MAALDDLYLQKVKNLYYQKKYSAREIADYFGVSIHAVYYFMRKHGIERRSFQDRNRVEFLKKPVSFSLARCLSLEDQALKIIGATLYWGEGYKTGKASGIDFANSDPAMVELFVLFLRRVCGIDEKRLRIFLYCYEGQDTERIKNFWSRTLKVPKKQFTKPYIKKGESGVQGKRMEYGLVHVRYADKKLLWVVKEWITEYKDTYCVGARVVKWSGL